MALSDLGGPRDGPRGGPVDARLDGQRGRRRRARISCGRAPALKRRWKPSFRPRSTSGRCAARAACGLRFDEASGGLKLTCPWRTSRRTALAWALDQRDWIDAQLERAEPASHSLPARHPDRGRARSGWRGARPGRARRGGWARASLRRPGDRVRRADRILPQAPRARQ